MSTYEIEVAVWEASETAQTSICIRCDGDNIFRAEGYSLGSALIEARQAIERSESLGDEGS